MHPEFPGSQFLCILSGLSPWISGDPKSEPALITDASDLRTHPATCYLSQGRSQAQRDLVTTHGHTVSRWPRNELGQPLGQMVPCSIYVHFHFTLIAWEVGSIVCPILQMGSLRLGQLPMPHSYQALNCSVVCTS